MGLPTGPRPASAPTSMRDRYRVVRGQTEELCSGLAVEDYGLQAMPDASPPKWHLAHTSWFFETFLLQAFQPGYRPFHPRYGYLFNSYYEAVGERHPRTARGLISRPTVAEVLAYRGYVDLAIARLLEEFPEPGGEVRDMLVLGLNHEQQHQELILTDTKYNLSVNPLRPAYATEDSPPVDETPPQLAWREYDEGVRDVGHDGSSFGFDNESPRHRVHLVPFRIGSRPVTNGEYLQFVEGGGYTAPRWWLSDGWRTIRERSWAAPLYWENIDGEWWHYTLHGLRPLDPAEPVCHVSYYEADAYAHWAGMRLPTEAEWEVAAVDAARAGRFLESQRFHPSVCPSGDGLLQMLGDVWEWTASPYTPYPGFRPAPGAVGEYNGKFMCSQMVLRGGSCATPESHIRPTYRNFFPPDARWQFSGIRLASD